MGKKVDRVILCCCYCGKKFKIIPWLYNKKLKRKTKKIYCSVVCRDSAEVGKDSPGWKGGRQKHGRYIQVWVGKGKRIFEHRLVMEKHIGRPVRRGEVIHHINGNGRDNRIENLVLCQNPGLHIKDFHR